MTTVFGPVSLQPAEAANAILDFVASRWHGYLESYFARVRYQAAEQSYSFFEETMKLTGRSDLMDRIRREAAGMFSCETDLGFAPSSVDIAVFSGPNPNEGTTVVATFEKELTSYLFTSEVTSVPFALSLEKLALAIGSECFLAAPDYDRWLPHPPSLLLRPETFDDSTQFVGWRDGVVDGSLVLRAIGAKPEWLVKTLGGFDIVPLMGKPRPLSREVSRP